MSHGLIQPQRSEPAAVASLALASGLLLGDLLRVGRWSCAAAGIAALGALALAVGSRRGKVGEPGHRLNLPLSAVDLALLSTLVLLGAARGNLTQARWAAGCEELGAVSGEAWVRVAAPPWENRTAATRLSAARPVQARCPRTFTPAVPVLLRLPAKQEPSLEARCAPREWREGFGEIYPARGRRFPGGWDELAYVRARGLAGVVRVGSLGQPAADVAERPCTGRARLGLAVARTLHGFRGCAGRWVQSHLRGSAGVFACSFLLGQGAAEDPTHELDVLSRAGVGHLAAVSGLNVGIVAGLCAIVLSLLPFGRRLRAVALAGFVLFFASLVGWGAAVTRAAGATTIWCLLSALGRRPRTGTLLAVLLALVLWTHPAAWRDAGLQLSYLVTYALFGAVRGIGRSRRPILRATNGALAFFGAQTAAWPLVLAQQCYASPLYLLSNALLVPLASFAVPLLAAGLLLAAVPAFPADVAAAPAQASLDLFLVLVRACAHLCDQVPVAAAPTTAVGLMAGIAVTVVWNTTRARILLRLVIALTICAATTLLSGPAARPPALYALDVGQGECWALFLRHETWVIDLGPQPGRADRARACLGPLLRAHGRRVIDRLFLTHDDLDHSGGLEEVESEGLRVKSVYHPAGWRPTPRVANWLDCARGRETQVMALARGDSWESEGVRVTALHPAAEAAIDSDGNASCLVLRLDIEGITVVVTGDAPGAAAEQWDDETLTGPAAIVSAGHHGSRGSTPAVLLARLTPQVVLVSAGRGNPFGHPHAETLTRILASRARLLRTDEDGSICITRDAAGWLVRGIRSGRVVRLTGRGADPRG